jgi:DNA-binding XRE family transcriptional regulator
MTYDIKDWRYRLGITQEKAAELLGVHRISYINWETGSVPVSKPVELALLACEVAYIAADQYVASNPVISHNITHKNQSETLGRIAIRKAFINEGRNNQKKPLIITLLPESVINYIK